MSRISKYMPDTGIIIYFFACLLACFGFHQVIASFGTYVIVMAVEGIIGVIFYYFYERYMMKREKKPSAVIPIIMIGVFTMQCLYVIVGEMINCYFRGDTVQWIFSGVLFVGIIGMGAAVAIRYSKGKLSAEQTVSVVIFVAFLFHLLYAQFTGAANIQRQNDTVAFTNGGGHLGYIWHVWAYGKLPQADPRTMWEFSQPPLYYILSGYWIKISSLLGVSFIKVAENIQFFSVFCVTATTIYVDKIMQQMKLPATKRIWGVLIISCIPYITYLSGAVNNDVLMVLLTVMSFCYALKWYEEPKLFTLVVTAVITGLLVMTKSSGALVAPAILSLFILRLWKDKGSRGRRVLEYLLFGVISLPIGLWWNVRNMIRFDMPFIYVNEPSIDSVQYIPDYTLWERLFDVKNQLNHMYIDLFNTSANVDHNIVISTIKALVFTQSSEMMTTKITHLFGLLLLIFTIILVVMMIVFGIIGLIKGKAEVWQKTAWAVLLISYLAFYLKFNLDYPFVHTMHARYLLPIFIIGVPWMLTGLRVLWEKLVNRGTKFKKYVKVLLGGWLILHYAILQCYIIQILIQAGEYI